MIDDRDLDLDAELREAQDNGYTPTAQMIVYLIQRLREAEVLARQVIALQLHVSTETSREQVAAVWTAAQDFLGDR